MMLARFLLLVAGLLALRVAGRSYAHRPIAASLLGAVALETIRELSLPKWLDLALYLAVPALSAWCALRVLARARAGEALYVAIPAAAVPCVAAVYGLGSWWSWLLAAHVGAVFAQVLAAAAWWRSSRRAGTSELCAIVLLAGDASALVGPVGLGGPWWIVTAQGSIVAVGLIAIQLASEQTRRAELRQRAAVRPRRQLDA